MRAETVPAEPQFTVLHDALPGLVTAIQAVDDAPRVHIDIETDDPEAEPARLGGLGAEQISQWLECRVLRAPGAPGLRDPGAQRPEVFDAGARTWG